MKWVGIAAFIGLAFVGISRGQTFTSTPAMSSSPMPVPAKAMPAVPARPPTSTPETLQLQALTKKIDEQNAKIDILSQQILKLEQQLATTRPGIMIGEAEHPTTSAAPAATPVPRLPGITSHTVARGETLTSIAKVYGVTIGELQRFNRIDDPLKLRAGQTLMIPPAEKPSATATGE